MLLLVRLVRKVIEQADLSKLQFSLLEVDAVMMYEIFFFIIHVQSREEEARRSRKRNTHGLMGKKQLWYTSFLRSSSIPYSTKVSSMCNAPLQNGGWGSNGPIFVLL